MANTINDLYLKYVNKVGKTLENDRYLRYLFEMVPAGSTTLQQNHKILHKQVDEAILPDDSTARKAKEQIDAFNEGVYNILSYHGRQRKPEVTDDDEE